MRVMTGAIAALALAGSSGARAQVYIADPAPPPVVVAPAPPAIYVAPAPPAIYVEPAARVTVVDPRTGRTCTIEASGYRWCWTP